MLLYTEYLLLSLTGLNVINYYFRQFVTYVNPSIYKDIYLHNQAVTFIKSVVITSS